MNPRHLILILALGLLGACGPKAKTDDPHAAEGHGAAAETEGLHKEGGSEAGVAKSLHRAEVVMSKEQQDLSGLQLGKAEMLPLRETLEVSGNIPDEPDHLVSITPSKPCVLTRLLVSVGENVPKGHAVARVRSGDKETDILAPQSGTILALPRSVGESIDTYSAVALLSDLTTLKVSLSAGEDEAGRLKVGQRVQVFHLSDPTEVHSGRITALSPRVDPETRLVRVGVKADNSNRHLRLGMYVTARFMLETGRVVLSVPEGAVQRVAEVETVYRPVPDEADAFLAVSVKTGERRGGRVEILSGLTDGDPLIVAGTFYLKSAQLKGKMGGGDGHGH